MSTQGYGGDVAMRLSYTPGALRERLGRAVGAAQEGQVGQATSELLQVTDEALGMLVGFAGGVERRLRALEKQGFVSRKQRVLLSGVRERARQGGKLSGLEVSRLLGTLGAVLESAFLSQRGG